VLDAVLAAEPAARPALARALCGDDPALAAEVASLVAAHRDAAGFLESDPAVLIGASDEDSPEPTDVAGQLVGRWRLLSELGRGGMGTVWLAERADGQFEQRAALKLIRRGMDSEEIRSRFRRERRILARLGHANIARLLDGDVSADGRPFFVMELVPGVPITRYCDESRLDLAGRLELFLVVCRAVEHAHRNLVVHGDLKPSNVLVGDAGGGTAVVKLVDFGIATALAADGEEPLTRLTSARARALTPEYAAPEQVRGEPTSTATDVYQLGLLLYELLAGRRPLDFRNRSLTEIERVVCTEPPPRPSTVGDSPRRRRLRGDLDTIALVALRKEPERRYPSAAGLADDVQAHLDGRPLRARGDDWRYLAGRFLRRHRAAVAVCAVFVALLGAVAIRDDQRVRAERSRIHLEAEKAIASNELLERFFQNWSPHGEVDDRTQVREQVDAEARRLALSADSADVRASTMSLLGKLYTELAQLDAAERLLAEADTIQRAGSTGPTPDLALTAARRGYLAKFQGRHREAEALLRESVGMWDALADQQDRRRLFPAWALGELLLEDGRYGEATVVLQRLVTPFAGQKVVPETIADARRSLGAALYHSGRFDQSDAVLRPALEAERAVAPDDRGTLEASRLLGSVLRDSGRLAEAEQVYHDVATRLAAKFGPDHLQTLAAGLVIGILRERQGDFVAAEVPMRAFLAGCARTYPQVPENACLAHGLQNLANVRLAQGELADAERHLRRTLEIQRKVYSGRNPDEGDHLNRLAYVLLRRGDPAGPQVYQEALAFHTARPTDEPLWVTDGLHYLAWAMAHQGNLAEAESLYRRTLELYRRTLPVGHPYRNETLAGLGEALLDLDQRAEACPLLAEAVAGWSARQIAVSATSPVEHAAAADARESFARCQAATSSG
jgi:serine/threonine-protein kinase